MAVKTDNAAPALAVTRWPVAMQNDESYLIEASRKGDAEAFGRLVSRYMPKALAFARQMTGSAEDAQDVAQEAFVKAFRGLRSFKGESGFYTWFFRLLSNTALDSLRKRAVRKRFFLFPRPAEDGADGPDDMITRAPDPDVSSMPDSVLEQKELRVAIQDALARLSDRQRAVFLLKHHEGLKITEIASALGISEGAVKSHLVRAVAVMRKQLKGYGNE